VIERVELEGGDARTKAQRALSAHVAALRELIDGVG
jgi:hypothetical protein